MLVLAAASFALAATHVKVKIPKGEAQVAFLQGTAEAVCPGQKLPLSLKINDMIQPGCVVTTGAGSLLELVLPDKSVVRIAEKTKFNLVSADFSDESGKRSIGISVGIGKAWMKVRKLLRGGDGKFEVSCHNAVAGVRGTVFRLDVENDQSALIKVYEGEVNVAAPKSATRSDKMTGAPAKVAGPTVVPGPRPVSMEEWAYIVKKMQQIRIHSDGKADAPKSFKESEDIDEWARWNKTRDQANAQ